MKDRNISILEKIIKYINEIEGTISRLEIDFSSFRDDYVAKNAISMCLLQIGELTGKLTDDFKAEHSEVKWRDITALRNRTAHAYGSIDVEILWKIIESDIPRLKEYCENIINEK